MWEEDSKIELQEILEVKNSLEVRLAEEKKRRIEAEKTQSAESRGTENKMCLSGDNLCITVPSFSGISTGILIIGLVLGLVCGCQLPSQFASRWLKYEKKRIRTSKNNKSATNFFKLPPGSATSSTAAALQLQRLRTPRTSTSTLSLTKAMRAINRNKP